MSNYPHRLALLAALGSLLGGTPGQSAHVVKREPRDSGGSTISRRKKRPGKRLRMARGAGSINCKADALQLCTLGRWNEAADMIEAHKRQCGERLFSDVVIALWRLNAGEAQP